ncbi:unnamed protein product [Amoebophrya sp. A25]|nr:unnamed protein product [Amoebophrya sp. A25]|eukprot:GSA25T00025052001.1
MALQQPLCQMPLPSGRNGRGPLAGEVDTPRCRFCLQEGGTETWPRSVVGGGLQKLRKSDHFSSRDIIISSACASTSKDVVDGEQEALEEKLIAACGCEGSAKWVHLSCLRKWQRTIQLNMQSNPDAGGREKRHQQCNLCLQAFKFQPLSRRDLLEDLTGLQPEALQVGRMMLHEREEERSRARLESLPLMIRVIVEMKHQHFRNSAYMLVDEEEDEKLIGFNLVRPIQLSLDEWNGPHKGLRDFIREQQRVRVFTLAGGPCQTRKCQILAILDKERLRERMILAESVLLMSEQQRTEQRMYLREQEVEGGDHVGSAGLGAKNAFILHSGAEDNQHREPADEDLQDASSSTKTRPPHPQQHRGVVGIRGKRRRASRLRRILELAGDEELLLSQDQNKLGSRSMRMLLHEQQLQEYNSSCGRSTLFPCSPTLNVGDEVGEVGGERDFAGVPAAPANVAIIKRATSTSTDVDANKNNEDQEDPQHVVAGASLASRPTTATNNDEHHLQGSSLNAIMQIKEQAPHPLAAINRSSSSTFLSIPQSSGDHLPSASEVPSSLFSGSQGGSSDDDCDFGGSPEEHSGEGDGTTNPSVPRNPMLRENPWYLLAVISENSTSSSRSMLDQQGSSGGGSKAPRGLTSGDQEVLLAQPPAEVAPLLPAHQQQDEEKDQSSSPSNSRRKKPAIPANMSEHERASSDISTKTRLFISPRTPTGAGITLPAMTNTTSTSVSQGHGSLLQVEEHQVDRVRPLSPATISLTGSLLGSTGELRSSESTTPRPLHEEHSRRASQPPNGSIQELQQVDSSTNLSVSPAALSTASAPGSKTTTSGLVGITSTSSTGATSSAARSLTAPINAMLRLSAGAVSHVSSKISYAGTRTGGASSVLNNAPTTSTSPRSISIQNQHQGTGTTHFGSAEFGSENFSPGRHSPHPTPRSASSYNNQERRTGRPQMLNQNQTRTNSANSGGGGQGRGQEHPSASSRELPSARSRVPRSNSVKTTSARLRVLASDDERVLVYCSDADAFLKIEDLRSSVRDYMGVVFGRAEWSRTQLLGEYARGAWGLMPDRDLHEVPGDGGGGGRSKEKDLDVEKIAEQEGSSQKQESTPVVEAEDLQEKPSTKRDEKVLVFRRALKVLPGYIFDNLEKDALFARPNEMSKAAHEQYNRETAALAAMMPQPPALPPRQTNVVASRGGTTGVSGGCGTSTTTAPSNANVEVVRGREVGREQQRDALPLPSNHESSSQLEQVLPVVANMQRRRESEQSSPGNEVAASSGPSQVHDQDGDYNYLGGGGGRSASASAGLPHETTTTSLASPSSIPTPAGSTRRRSISHDDLHPVPVAPVPPPAMMSSLAEDWSPTQGLAPTSGVVVRQDDRGSMVLVGTWNRRQRAEQRVREFHEQIDQVERLYGLSTPTTTTSSGGNGGGGATSTANPLHSSSLDTSEASTAVTTGSSRRATGASASQHVDHFPRQPSSLASEGLRDGAGGDNKDVSSSSSLEGCTTTTEAPHESSGAPSRFASALDRSPLTRMVRYLEQQMRHRR